MELINNLIQHNLIRPGTWLGVCPPQTARVHQRLRVERIDAHHVAQLREYLRSNRQSITGIYT